MKTRIYGDQIMLLEEALKNAITLLNLANIETPAFEAGVILCHVLKCDKIYLYLNSKTQLDIYTVKCFFLLINQRVQRNPLSYILGNQGFMSLDFKVTEEVLIPRADTEILVESILDRVSINTTKITILDIGTGSGCIAISLAKYIKDCQIVAVDISEKALDIAKFNAKKHGVLDKVQFKPQDIFSTNLDLIDDSFDVIVSNPPYIRAKDVPNLQPEISKFEPMIALDGGSDGLMFYKQITNLSTKYLKNDGILAFEIGYDQKDSVLKIMSKYFYNLAVIKDYGNNDRVLIGLLNKERDKEPVPLLIVP